MIIIIMLQKKFKLKINDFQTTRNETMEFTFWLFIYFYSNDHHDDDDECNMATNNIWSSSSSDEHHNPIYIAFRAIYESINVSLSILLAYKTFLFGHYLIIDYLLLLLLLSVDDDDDVYQWVNEKKKKETDCHQHTHAYGS